MKTTIEIPDNAYRQAKVLVASSGMTLKRFCIQSFEEKLHRCARARQTREEEAPWMAGFGVLADLSNENRFVLGAIEEEFETLAPEDIA